MICDLAPADVPAGGCKVSRDALTDVDAVFERLLVSQAAPGIAYGIVIDGKLVHARGLGTRRMGSDLTPDEDTVFRIASMTKSFTASAILLLRDRRRLRLDDTVAMWVPELKGDDQATTDPSAIAIEHLLTMSAGFPTDDRWGDRQQGLDLHRFEDFLRGGVSRSWAPGTRFEYSNLGYGILGLIVTRASGMEYRTFVAEELIAPLELASTTYLRDEIPEERFAQGYVRRDGEWLAEPIDPYGALAPMGGLFTSVRDLARWVQGFAGAFPPEAAQDGHPLSRASRREMQQARRSFDPELTWESADAAPALLSGGYGYGLFVTDDLRFGRFVGHGGGYPGYGSYMRWHPGSGIGIIALANGRYVPMIHPASEALAVLLRAHAHRIRPLTTWAHTDHARMIVERLLHQWDDEAARALFAMNIELDEPVARRRAAIEHLRDVHGSLRPDLSAKVESHSPAHLAWWMVGDRGRVRVEILLDPERPPRMQVLTFTSVPEPSPALCRIALVLVDLLAQPGPSWPAGVALAGLTDRLAIERSFRAAEALFGPAVLGPAISGDGATRATWRVTGQRGELDLTLELDGPDGAVTVARFVPRPISGPIDAIQDRQCAALTFPN